MKKANKDPRKVRFMLLAIGLGFLLIVIGGFSVRRYYVQKADRKKFQSIEQKKTDVVGVLTASLGDKVTTTEDASLCFNTEQGPYDNGKLWCQAASKMRLNEDISFEELGSKFITAANEKGLETGSEKGRLPRFWFDVDNGRYCELSLVNSSGEVFGGATQGLLTSKDSLTMAVACADRAKAKYYRYIE